MDDMLVLGKVPLEQLLISQPKSCLAMRLHINRDNNLVGVTGVLWSVLQTFFEGVILEKAMPTLHTKS